MNRNIRPRIPNGTRQQQIAWINDHLREPSHGERLSLHDHGWCTFGEFIAAKADETGHSLKEAAKLFFRVAMDEAPAGIVCPESLDRFLVALAAGE